MIENIQKKRKLPITLDTDYKPGLATKIDEYYSTKPNRNDEREKVYFAFKSLGMATDREVSEFLCEQGRIIEPSTVSARRNELLQEKRIEFVGKTYNPIMKSKPSLWKAV